MPLTLDGKPWWVGLVLGLLITALMVGAVEMLVVKDIKAEIASAESQIAELDKKIEQGRAAERKLPQFREEVKRLELELEKLRRILPSSRNTEEIIKKIKSLVDQGNFTLKKLTFPKLGPAKAGDPYAEWPISVEVDGRYHDLAILFNRLSNFSRIINVEQISIRALGIQEEKTVSANFTAKTFVYVESEPAPEKKKGDKAKAGAGEADEKN
jgi:type IV pilus assembly protein PilO